MQDRKTLELEREVPERQSGRGNKQKDDAKKKMKGLLIVVHTTRTAVTREARNRHRAVTCGGQHPAVDEFVGRMIRLLADRRFFQAQSTMSGVLRAYVGCLQVVSIEVYERNSIPGVRLYPHAAQKTLNFTKRGYVKQTEGVSRIN